MLIAFSGHRKAGKTSLARFMQDICVSYGMEEPEILSFASPLKELYCELNNLDIATLLLPDVKENHRKGLEDLSEQVKAEDPTFFTDRLFAKINPAKHQIIDDLRLFDIEFIPLFEKKVPIWRVYADYDKRRSRGALYDKAVDESKYERDLDWSAYTYYKLCGTGYIFNNKTPEDLKVEAHKLVSRYFFNL